MLLLVLILVLIAFSLLVAALLSGSVLWAWVSVGVSVAAAVVLLIDYMQRRNAVMAGAEVGAAARPSRAGPPDMESATELLPVVPRTGSTGGATEGSQQESATALVDHGFDGQQTIVMPVVPPSVSAERPSGASLGVTSSSGEPSPTVTTAGPGRSDVPSRSDDGREDSGDALADVSVAPADATVAAPEPAGDPPDAAELVGASGAAAQEPAAEGATAGDPPGGTGAQQDPAPPAAEEEPPEEPPDPTAAAVVAALENEVLVIDEQPRYHVIGCRSLVGKPLIPLPAREAVELGFTPCGWCSPDRTLAAQAAAY